MRLGVNIDHVATVRQARGTNEPDPVAAAFLVEAAGAHGIVLHLREDRRHMQDRDLKMLREVVKLHLNLEMAATKEMAEIAVKTKPDMVTLVPEKRQELTTEGGLDVAGIGDALIPTITGLKNEGLTVSLFVDPDVAQIKAAAKTGAHVVELHTGEYANARSAEEGMAQLERLRNGAILACKLGLGVSAGHGLTYQNVADVAAIDHIEELNIGHSIISRAILYGLEKAVRDMLDLIRRA
jgi:pyridoxine 5-phosphate synthase